MHRGQKSVDNEMFMPFEISTPVYSNNQHMSLLPAKY